MDDIFWSTRNVAEYAYCSRLFYLMEVEGVFIPSADTEEGVSIHKRVDRPSAVSDDEEETGDTEEDKERPKIVRSLALSSSSLGLTAKLDLAEISGKAAVPVEYRKGKSRQITMSPPPDELEDAEEPTLVQREPWPTDRVQVGLQSLLLEEAGYEVTKTILYYATEKQRLEIPFDDELRAQALETLKAAKTCACGSRPLPLVNDSRCPKCSLQPICLPDEVNFQRVETPTDENLPRKIWPPRDDGIHVVAQEEGVRIGVKGMALKVTNKEGAVVKEIPLVAIESLSVLGGVQISTQAVQVLADKSIPIAFLTSAGRLVAMIDPLDSVSADVRKAQVRKFDDSAIRLAISKAVVQAKIVNQRKLLMRNHQCLSDHVATDMASLAENVSSADAIETVRGFEGRAAAIYFENFSGMLKTDMAKEFDANGRQRRPPPDPVNACLSFAYSMLTNECVAALRLASLEPSIGAFHVFRPGRPAFALDLMEPFRPLIADSIIIAAFNRGELKEGHFLKTAAGCSLTNYGRRAFFNAYGRRMNEVVTHPVFEYRLSYRRMLTLHARMVAAWLLEEIPTLSFLTTR